MLFRRPVTLRRFSSHLTPTEAQKFEVGNHSKRLLWLPYRFAHLLNQVGRSVSQEFRGFVDVRHSIGFETHEAGTRRIGGYRIISQNNTAQLRCPPCT